MLGRLSVICARKPGRLPKEAAFRLFRVTDSNGARIGLVTDVLLDEASLRVTALEISSGPVDDLITGRWYATAFDVRALGNTGHVTVPCRQNKKGEKNMKLSRYMMSGAVLGYAVGCKMEKARKAAMRAVKRAKRMLARRLGL